MKDFEHYNYVKDFEHYNYVKDFEHSVKSCAAVTDKYRLQVLGLRRKPKDRSERDLRAWVQATGDCYFSPMVWGVSSAFSVPTEGRRGQLSHSREKVRPKTVLYKHWFRSDRRERIKKFLKCARIQTLLLLFHIVSFLYYFYYCCYYHYHYY